MVRVLHFFTEGGGAERGTCRAAAACFVAAVELARRAAVALVAATFRVRSGKGERTVWEDEEA